MSNHQSYDEIEYRFYIYPVHFSVASDAQVCRDISKSGRLRHILNYFFFDHESNKINTFLGF